MMNNYEIADCFSLLAKLMDIHGENSFKTRTYSSAAFQIEKLPEQLSEMDPHNIAGQKGIGAAVAQKIIELLQTQKMALLQDYIDKTPPGVIEMLNIKGIGPKKINTIWKEMGIESVGELQYACNENRLTMYKGFGEKTQNNVAEAIAFYLNQQGLFLYQQLESLVNSILNAFRIALPAEVKFETTGAYRRQLEVLDEISFLTTSTKEAASEILSSLNNLEIVSSTEDLISCNISQGPKLQLHFATNENWGWRHLETTGSDVLVKTFMLQKETLKDISSESSIFEALNLPLVPPCLRESADQLAKWTTDGIPDLIKQNDIRGIIHSHSKWSDGNDSIEQMAVAAKNAGLEYLVISDHSRSAAYANGLSVERIAQQHVEIDALNVKLAPFKIFKSIECDILGDGTLDYPDEVLQTFDLVIASVHSNLKMTEEKAMQRLLTAIANPHVTILGHMTGRLLLSRNGYPLNHPVIIDACIAHNVVIELNAHPRRLDIDWRWIPYALEKGALISINPDAHSVEGFADTHYGVLAAQKGALTANSNLSSFPLPVFEAFLTNRKIKNLSGS